MKHQQTNIFVGLQTDNDIQFLKEGEYTDAENIRLGSSVANNVGTVETLYGSLGLTMPTPPLGNDKIVGKCKDIQYGLVYIFIYNSLGNHRILKLDTNNDTISIVLKSQQLFQNDAQPTFVSTTIYDKQLFWCNGTNFDKSSTLRHLDLNLDWSTYNYADNIEDLISNIKRPSLLPITTVLQYNAGVTSNKLRDLSFQFCFRLVLKNGQQTRFSPISQLAISGYDIATKPNQIELTIPLFGTDNAILSKVVKYIEVAFRGSYNEDFKSFKKIDFQSTPYNEILLFFNNEAYSTVTPSDYITEYDNSPLFASSVQYADTRVFWGNYQQERYKQPLNVTSDTGAVDGTISYTPIINQQCLKPTSTYKYSIELIDKYGRRTTAMVDGTNMGSIGSITTATQVGLVSTLQKKKITIDLRNIADDYKETGAIQIRRSQNLDFARFIQGRIEHAYYKTGTDVNGKPLFVKPIDWATQNYTTFDYVTNKNIADGGATELYLDISNWARSNISYTYAEGDKVRVLTYNNVNSCNNTTASSNIDRVEYSIIRQEGDILVLSYKNPITIHGTASFRGWEGSDYQDRWYFVGSNGYICRRANETGSDEVLDIVNSTYSGWEDIYGKSTYYGCSVMYWADSPDDYIEDMLYVCGENGLLLKINFVDKSIYKFNTGTTSTLRNVFSTIKQGSPDVNYLISTGDINDNGYGEVIVISNEVVITNATNELQITGNIVSSTLPISVNRNLSGFQNEQFILVDRMLFITDKFSDRCFKLDLHLGTTIYITDDVVPIVFSTEIGSLFPLSDVGCKRLNCISWAFLSVGSWWYQIVGDGGVLITAFETDTFANIDISLLNQKQRLVFTDRGSNNIFVRVINPRVLVSSTYPIGFLLSDNCNVYLSTCFAGAYSPQVKVIPELKSIGSIMNTFHYFLEDMQSSTDGRIRFIIGGQNKTTYNYNIAITGTLDYTTLGGLPYRSVVDTPSEGILNYGAMIEVYTPASQLSEQIYYEIGNVHKISEYEGDDYVYDIDLNDGDCFYISKQFYGRLWTSIKDNIISMSPTKDTWSFWHKDIGRPNVEDLTVDFATNNTQKYIPFRNFTSNIIFSNPYIQGTKTNGLCSFEPLNYKQLPIEYGGITALQVANNTNEDGTIMLSVHKHEVVSIYIGKVQYTDVAGNNTISLSDTVLGSFRTTNGSLGSVNPESIAQYNSAVYGFDAIKGVVWRYGQNGVTRLSDVGMRNFFYNQGRYYLQQTSYSDRLIGEYNNYFDEYCLTLPNTNQTMIWSERYNRWICSRNYSSEIGDDLKFQASIYNKNYIGLNLQVEEGIYNAKIYKTDVQGQEVGKLVDTYRPASITTVANKEPNSVKNWNNIRIQTDQCWDIQANTETGQVTYMYGEENEVLETEGDSQELENNFYAPVLNDATTQVVDRYDGMPLKSQVLTIKLTLNKELIDLKEQENNIIKLYNITTYSSISFR